MTAGAYYNEHDKDKAAWLVELIRCGIIAYGEIDTRSIKEVQPSDLAGFTQCHFFAGIGVWSYSLRLAGWPDDRPVWTGSCPCPSFSAAGKGEGFDDPRHLWPDWYRLVPECEPPTIFGEQADNAIGFGWLDLVQTDLERANYAVGKAVLGACSVGAPHIRQRLYFCANSMHSERGPIDEHRQDGCDWQNARRPETHNHPRARSEVFERSNSDGGHSSNGDLQRSWKQRLFPQDSGTGDSNHSIGAGLERHVGDVRKWRGPGWLDPIAARSVTETGATRGSWSDCDWWHARDEKFRPIEPGIFPLAYGVTNRVLKLRGYGDAIVPQVAAAFIEASMTVNV